MSNPNATTVLSTSRETWEKRVQNRRGAKAQQAKKIRRVQSAIEDILTGKGFPLGSACKRYTTGLPFAKGWYVYCLMHGSELRYIGETDNLCRRIGQHVDNGRNFDAVEVIKCKSESHMHECQNELIRMLQPPENKILYAA